MRARTAPRRPLGFASRWPLWHAFALLVAVAFAAASWRAYREYAFEDAYITYRYAANLAGGRGFVFNPGERLLGTTTPLYTLLLAALGRLGADIPTASGVLFCASLAGSAVAGALLLARVGHPALGLGFAVFCGLGPGRVTRMFGMETPFYWLLLLGALLAAHARRRLATGVLLGLAFLTRYDAVLFAASLIALLAWRDRRLPWREPLAALAVALPWLVFAAAYFGSVLPNTLSSKAGASSMAQYLYESAALQLENLIAPLERVVPGLSAPPIVVAAVGVLAIAGPVLSATPRLVRREPLLAALLLFPLGLWFGYAWIGAPVQHSWHLLPGTVCLVLYTFACWGMLGETPRRSSWGVPLVAALGSLALLAHVPTARAEGAGWVASSHYRSRIGAYGTIARWIVAHDLGELRVAMREPGYFAYLSDNPIVDAAGLVTEGVSFHASYDERTSASELIEAFAPELIVTSPPRWPWPDPAGYVPLYHAVPARTLLIERAALERHYPSLRDDWLAPEAPSLGGGSPARHPLVFDFAEAGSEAWATSGNVGEVRGIPGRVRYAGRRLREPSLHTYGPESTWGRISSPPFVIDFDELQFRFCGTERDTTRVRLLVDGQAVLETPGEESLEMRDVSWPVAAWSRRVGVLQLVDDADRGFAVLGRVRSVRFSSNEVLDDFEAGVYDERWRSTFGEAPGLLDPLAARLGLALQVGRYAALSEAMRGRVEMSSHPFMLRKDRLSLLVFDFGGPRCTVELRVGGKPVRTFRGRRSDRLVPIVWDVSEFVGESVELAVTDGHPHPSSWIGIDEVRLHQSSEE